MKTLSIGITTFRNRFEDIQNQIIDIRNYDEDIDIILAITSNYNEKMLEEYRKGLLSFCCKYKNIYPLMFPRYTGLSKMWNNLIVHSATSHIIIMNDDITFKNPIAINEIKSKIQSEEIFTISTFGVFVISKCTAHEMSYFDERLIAYGHEDGDFKKRYKEKYETEIKNLPINNIKNRVQNRKSDSYDKNIECFKDYAGGNKPLINNKIMSLKNKNKWANEKQYPYEQFINDNYHNIGNVGEVIWLKEQI